MSTRRPERGWPALLAIAWGLSTAACAPNETTSPGPRLSWDLVPRPARVGMARISFSLSDAAGRPVRALEVEVEANMSHPGMVPEFAPASELEPGNFRAELELTMGGDWYLIFRGRMPDGGEFELREDLPAVLSR